jgi:hypothetical protein
MPRLQKARWWSARLAHNRRPVTYTCPLCGRLLPALTEHMLLLPEGDASRRRHAHTRCVMKARSAGRLPTREEFEARSGRAPRRGPMRRLYDALRAR